MRFIILFILTFITHIVYAQDAVWVIPPQYDQITPFSEGVAAVRKNGKWGYINIDGDIIAECRYDKAYPFSEGVGVVTSIDDTIDAIIDIHGASITEFKDENGDAKSFQVDPRFALYGDGLLLVTDGSTAQLYDRRKYKRWGYLDQNGSLQLEVKYFGALPFSDGLAGVAYEKLKYAYITPGGTVAISNDFNRGSTIGAMGFYQGRSIVVGEKGLAGIDSRGRKASAPIIEFSPLENFYNTTNNFIRGEEGNLEFDSRGRVTSFVNNRGERVVLRTDLNVLPSLMVHKMQKNGSLPSGLNPGDVSVVQMDGLVGLLTLNSGALLNVKIKSSDIETMVGPTTNVQFFVENVGGRVLRGVDIYCDNDMIINNAEILSSGCDFKVAVPNSAYVERENITLNIRIDNKGLELYNQDYSATLINKSLIERNIANSLRREREEEERMKEVEEIRVKEEEERANAERKAAQIAAAKQAAASNPTPAPAPKKTPPRGDVSIFIK